jgi:trans-aconitate methyltransferase
MKIDSFFDGGKYEKFSQHQREWGDKLINELKLKGDETILDLGCGNGLTTKALAERVPQGKVVGIDWSPSMLEIAKSHKTENMELMLLDINEMSFDNEFDVVFSNATLHWVLNHKRLMRNIYFALKPGGFMRIQFARDGNCPNFSKIIRETMELPIFKRHFENFTWLWYTPKIEYYERLLSKTKFKGYKTWGENIKYYFPDEISITGWIEQPSIIPFLAVLPEDLKILFRNTVVERIVKETKQSNGTYLEIFRRINAYAKK